MRSLANKTLWSLAAIVFLPILALTLTAQQTNSFSINGQQGSAKVIQVNGHNYVEVESLARLTNGSLSFSGSQIVLTLPGTTASAPAPAAAPAPTTGFSKDFITSAIEEMAQVREWRTALKSALERGIPLSSDWLGPYRDQARQALRLTSVAVNTDADRNAFPFLTNEFNNMSLLTDKYVGMAKSMTYIDPNSLASDSLDQKIRTCAHSLASMAATNQFVDDGSCQ